MHDPERWKNPANLQLLADSPELTKATKKAKGYTIPLEPRFKSGIKASDIGFQLNERPRGAPTEPKPPTVGEKFDQLLMSIRNLL